MNILARFLSIAPGKYLIGPYFFSSTAEQEPIRLFTRITLLEDITREQTFRKDSGIRLALNTGFQFACYPRYFPTHPWHVGIRKKIYEIKVDEGFMGN